MTQSQEDVQPTQLLLFDEAVLATYIRDSPAASEGIPDPQRGRETSTVYIQLVLPGFEERTEEKET